ncbi:MAG TPA: hypothetical protein VIP70_13275 [Nitrososphaeraceae archaeon]
MDRKEHCSNENRIIIGKTTICIDPDCRGWLVDSFSGKYWIKCLDPKHNNLNTKEKKHQMNLKIERVGQMFFPTQAKPSSADDNNTRRQE